MNTRFLLFKTHCPFCLEYMRIVPSINIRLPPEKRIKLIDAFEWENFDIKPHPVMDKFDAENFKGYPFLYLDGVIYEEGGLPSEQLKIMLDSYFQEEYIF